MAGRTHGFHLDNYTGYRLIAWGARNVPFHLANWIGRRITDFFFYTRPGQVVDEQVRNFDVVLGDAVSHMSKRKLVRNLWRNWGRFLLEMFRFERMTDSEIAKLVPEFVGLEHIKRAHEKGRGVVVMTAHIGHWELGGILLDHLGYKINVVLYPYESEEKNRMLDKNKAVRGIKIIQSNDPVSLAVNTYNALKRNEIVAIQGDRDVDRSGLRVDFFGRPAYFPKGPVLIAMKTGAPLVPAFTIAGKARKYHPIAEPAVEMVDTGDFDADLRENMRRAASAIEKYVRAYPEQWFNFYGFWE